MRRKKPKEKPSSILGKAKPVSQMETVITAVFYGRAGTGKTTLAASFPGNKLFLDIGERGTDSISDRKDCDTLQINEWPEFEEVYWELKESDHKYTTVIIDAEHTLQGLALTECKIRDGKKPDAQTSQRIFGQASALMTEWNFNFRDLRDQGINVVFLVHDRVFDVETEEGDEAILPEVGPRLMPSTASALTGMVNIVGNTFIKQTKIKSKTVGGKTRKKIDYCLRIGPDGYYHTKIRKPKGIELPEFIVDPSYDKLVSLIKAKPTLKRRRKNGTK